MLPSAASVSSLGPDEPGRLVQLVRDGLATTRPELMSRTGVSRSAITRRVGELLAAGLLLEDGRAASTGGRPASQLRFNAAAGHVLVADLGATHVRVAVTDLAGDVLAEHPADLRIDAGPLVVLDWVRARFDDLLGEVPVERPVRGIGIGVPGPVEYAAGRAVSPPIMPGWDGYPIPHHFREFGVPVVVDNDVNLMALGEYCHHWRKDHDDLLLIKVGTGIGCGIIASGRIHRGAQGSAGDLGHVPVPGHDDRLCACGNVGCVEAVAGGQAIADRLREVGQDTRDARAVVRRVLAGDSEAIQAVREAGRVLGQVVATAVNLFNPSVIVIGGDLADAREQLLAGVREIVYRRSLPLATRHLQLVSSLLGDRSGIRGASDMVVGQLLAPAALDRWLGTSHTASAASA